MLGLGLSLTTGGVITPYYAVVANAFRDRVEADGGTVDSFACLKTDMAYLTSNPDAPAGYTAEWSNATVGSSAEFRINLVGGAGYTYTYAVTDTQATEVTGTGVMGGDIQAVTADLSTLVDGTVTLAVYLTGAGGDGNVVTDTANLVGVDADAQAFITAAAITDSTQQSAIDTLVTDLKTAGVWTKMKAIYPIVGGTASSHKFNLKDPRDLDAAFRLTFSSGWTHSSTGATPNGTSAFAQTYFAPNGNLSQNDAHASLYSRTNILTGNQIDLGCGSDPLSSNTDFYLSANYLTYGCISNLNGSSFGGGVSQSDSLGLYLSQRTSSVLTSKYKNNVLVHTHSNISTTPTSGFINLGRNTTGEYSSRELAFVTLGDSFTDTERGDLYTAIQAFQTTLGRQV